MEPLSLVNTLDVIGKLNDSTVEVSGGDGGRREHLQYKDNFTICSSVSR
jgi:hypothetical protein